MKVALVSPNEVAYSYDGIPLGARIAEVTTQSFDVASPLFWVECSDDVISDQFYWNGNDCIAIPQPSL